jgi:hypothetical protein
MYSKEQVPAKVKIKSIAGNLHFITKFLVLSKEERILSQERFPGSQLYLTIWNLFAAVR